ncbi:DUF5592 family protein [Fructilactobacillus cliffordii]|uniref:DUF5592 family protein n=1 Tax=Fructilactobacillus cliffordii TaxID=2940299 RepID=A0A9Q8ZT03_9LACO|nr:DUF5592 family protein [Fructilactobacillus cliffordii]USS89997.1 DUF5592 family protein [Fructilactobacillus cliffordii]
MDKNYYEAEIRNVGVTKGINAPMKMAIFFVRDIVVLLGVFGFCVMSANIFPPDQHIRLIIYYIVNMLFTVWLIIPVFSNPGKRNYNLIWDSIFGIFDYKFLRSFDYYEFDSFSDLSSIGGGMKNGNKSNS